MPITYHKEVNQNVYLAVWEIRESKDELSPLMRKTDYAEIGKDLINKKKLEIMAARLTVKYLVEKSGNEYHGLYKDEYGKPHLAETRDIHLSISHAYPYAAAIIDLSGPTGIDIETRRQQVFRIKHKFLSADELAEHQHDIDQLTIIWAAKESLYKIHGRKNLIFRQDLRVTFVEQHALIGEILLPDQQRECYELECQQIAEHWLVFKVNTCIRH